MAPSAYDDRTRCGIGPCKSGLLQPCARMGVFTIFYSLAYMTSSSLLAYVNSQVTTLERQFGFSSAQTGIILAANDIGYVICVLLASFFAQRVHIPRTLGICIIIFGVSGLTCALPHFLYGLTREGSDNSTNSKNSKSLNGEMCFSQNGTVDLCSSKSGESSNGAVLSATAVTASYAIIVTGMLLQGVGKGPRFSFSTTYVDNNTNKVHTGYFMGISVAAGLLGPAVSFLLGGIFNDIYVTLGETNLTPDHPNWIGAWWLGFVVFGGLALIVAIPLMFFPRKMPSRTSEEDNSPQDKEADTGKKSESSGSVPAKDSSADKEERDTPTEKSSFQFLLQQLIGCIKCMLRLLINPVYMLTNVSACLIIFAISTQSFSQKYFEQIFDLSASDANYIMSAKTFGAKCLGTLIGGILTRKMKMTAYSALKWTNVFVFITFLANAAGFFIKCVQPTVHNWPGDEDDACSRDCACDERDYFPICGGDGLTYYSPCFAGCGTVENKRYSNCTCISGGSAVSGTCDYGCPLLYALIFTTMVRSLFQTMAISPKLVIFIRSVADADKTVAVGFSSFANSLLGWLLGPIILGRAIDSICTIWEDDCGSKGRCLLYDNDNFRISIHTYSSVAFAGSLLCLSVAYIYAKWTKCLENDDEKVDDKNKKYLENGDKVAHDKDSK